MGRRSVGRGSIARTSRYTYPELDAAHRIDVFLFAPRILHAVLWLLVLSSRDPARDEETPQRYSATTSQ